MTARSFNFLKYRFHAACLSIIFICAGVAGYVYNGGFRYSVDFTGGTQVMFKFSNPVGSEGLKTILARAGWEDAVTREFSNTEIVIRVKEFVNDSQGLALAMRSVLEENLPNDTQVTILEANGVGPGTGQELRWNFLLMLCAAFLIMFLYIVMRFWSFSYGVGTVVALLHDPLAILAVIAITKMEISPNVICAIIAALGYSINDTIVIFARIRERFASAKPGESPSAIVNESLNKTLSRTILTSLATFLVVAALFVFGGESLRDLSLSFMVGIVVGTYSSIFVASPTMLFFRR